MAVVATAFINTKWVHAMTRPGARLIVKTGMYVTQEPWLNFVAKLGIFRKRTERCGPPDHCHARILDTQMAYQVLTLFLHLCTIWLLITAKN